MHVTTETANLMRALVASGAHVALCASNPLSTQDDTAASLVRDFGVSVHAVAGEDMETYEKHLEAVIAINPQIIMDDGADLDTALHTTFTDKLQHVIGGTEETTTGVVRLMSMAAEGTLAYPVFNINDANTKHCFDNHYGTGQSTLDGIVRATNRLLCGRTIVISGYGYCGSGLALRARGMGMNVIVCEIDPLKALEAHMEGYQVMKAEDAARELAAEGDLSGSASATVPSRSDSPGSHERPRGRSAATGAGAAERSGASPRRGDSLGGRHRRRRPCRGGRVAAGFRTSSLRRCAEEIWGVI